MSLLAFTFKTEYSFETPVKRHHIILKCLPPQEERQNIRKLVLNITPGFDLQEDFDSFGNKLVYGTCYEEHTEFAFQVQGEIETGNMESGLTEDPIKLGMYRYGSKYTKAGEEILAYDREQKKALHTLGNIQKLEIAYFLMGKIYEIMTYCPGVTNINTMAEDAFLLKKGVCQDYAHIFLSLLRLHHITARYVVGMMVGEGKSHAWVEIENQGKWYGFDPTHNCRVDENYIKISQGRDYEDCIVDKGILFGGGRQTQNISVSVKRMEEIS